ncbi:hypothetical protein FALCPG4_018066 [Fusarium falciforme]
MGIDTLFHHDLDHRVIVCLRCKTCLVPNKRAWERHLRAEPHRLAGEALQSTLKLLSAYDLLPVDELKKQSGRNRAANPPCRPIEGLALLDGYSCVAGGCGECGYSTQCLAKMHGHMPVHGKKASEHGRDGGPLLWKACKLQTYFTAKGLIDYFVVQDIPLPSSAAASAAAAGASASSSSGPPPSEEEKKWFASMRADRIQASRDVEEKGGVVEGESAARADRVPWLVRTGFPDHLQGLRDLEIRSSYTLPPPMKPASGSPDGNGEDKGGDKGEGPASRGSESDLCRIVAAAEVYLRDAYALCSDRSTEQKLTEQRAKRLSRFSEAAASGTGNPSASFRSFKNQSTLTQYFRRMKQLYQVFPW